MAKKKVEKKIKEAKKVEEEKRVKPKFSEAERLFLDNSKAIHILENRIIALEQRIDRIVTAIGKAKSVKGL